MGQGDHLEETFLPDGRFIQVPFLYLTPSNPPHPSPRLIQVFLRYQGRMSYFLYSAGLIIKWRYEQIAFSFFL